MKHRLDTISKKVTLLNKIILDSMAEEDNKSIVKNFTEAGIEILEADFGFAWWKFSDKEEYKLVYKSSNTPYEPTLPRKKAGNYIAQKTKKPFFDSNVRKENYEFNITDYLKSYIIIPIFYDKYIYGNLVFCYKKQHEFTQDELTLSNALGNTTAQAITVHRLVKTEVLLDQEKLKTEFIANATHELRTPLAIMKGNVDLALLSKNDPKEMKSALKAVNNEIKILSEIFKDLALLTSQNDKSKQLISKVPVNVSDLLEDITRRMKAVANERKIAIKLKTVGKNISIPGDKIYLEKLFLNLIKNAVTYGKDNGHILIDVSKNKNRLNIKITDNGIGISKDDLPKVFERFYRADKAHSAYGTHSGLGLAIAKWVAEAHQGNIQATSTHGKGSTFTVTLPIK